MMGAAIKLASGFDVIQSAVLLVVQAISRDG